MWEPARSALKKGASYLGKGTDYYLGYDLVGEGIEVTIDWKVYSAMRERGRGVR